MTSTPSPVSSLSSFQRDPSAQRTAATLLTARNDHSEPSVLRPENLLREARRQKRLTAGTVPRFCVLDPDGDIVDHVRRSLGACESPHWACFHTKLWEYDDDRGRRIGVVGSAVGSSFAVLVAEQLFVSGCAYLVSIASAGWLATPDPDEVLMIIGQAFRDEGTSHHYLPPSPTVAANRDLVASAATTLAEAGLACRIGASWTTDAPFRETERTISARRAAGAVAVEMEAAALYAFAEACGQPVLCLAHLTNRLGQVEGDFEKGEGNGVGRALRVVSALAATHRADP